MPTVRAKISNKSQIVLPKELRERLAAGPGDTLVFHYDERGVRVEKAPLDEHSAPSMNGTAPMTMKRTGTSNEVREHPRALAKPI